MRREVFVLAAGVEIGVEIDFQYVSTAPPISRFTPLKAFTTLTSNEICDELISEGRCYKQAIYFSDNIEMVIEYGKSERLIIGDRCEGRRQ